MQLNKVLKGLMIALPVLAVTACSSNSDSADTTGTQTNQQQAQQAPATQATPVTQEDKMSEQALKDKVQKAKTVYFAFDNATIDSNYEDMLSAHAMYLVSNPTIKVTIEGHADERGTPEYNIALGERRAEAVEKYLEALGVQPSQISIVSYGEEKPLVQGHNEAAYAKNRRAVIVY